MWIEVCLLLLVACYALHLWAFSYWKRRGVFQVEGSFIFGNIKDILFMKKTLDNFIWEIYSKHKDHKLVGIYSFYTPMLVVTDPALVRQIKVTDFNSFNKPLGEIDANREPALALNPFFTDDLEAWKERRGFHLSMLTPSKLKTMPELLIDIGGNMIKFIKEKKNSPIKIGEICELFAIDVVSTFTFGYEPTAFRDQGNSFRKYARANMLTMESGQALNSAMLYPIVAKILSYRAFNKESEDFFRSMNKQMMEFRKRSPSNRSDIFEHIAKTNAKLIQEGKRGLTEDEILAYSVGAYIDSYFTTSSGLSYLLWELSQNPDVQEKLRAEILNVGKEMHDFDYDKINSIEFLQMAMTESLRIHPPVFVTGRTCSKTTELEGVKIEKGTRVLLPFFAFHKDPYYFPEPEKYIPERFMSEESIVKGTVQPFGDGPRMCLGFRYATLVMKICVIYLLLNFKLSPEPKPKEEKAERLFPLDFPDDTMKILFHPIEEPSK